METLWMQRTLVKAEDQVSTRKDMEGLFRLMDRYIDGDREAFSRLHQRLMPRLKGFLLKIVRNATVVDDLLQLTFLKAHLARDSYQLQEGDPDGSVQAWYFTIARNVAMDHLRKQSRGTQKLMAHTDSDRIENAMDTSPSIEDYNDKNEQEIAAVKRVRNAISQLPASQREVVELHKLRGMAMAEVAERLSIREGAARVRAHRGYKALARLLTSALPVTILLFTRFP